MNGLELLKEHCNFITENDCYVLLAVSRKKDTPEFTQSKEIIFREIIKKKEDIEKKYLKIKSYITNFKNLEGKSFPFYLYVSLNRRDGKKASFILMNKMLGWAQEESVGVNRSRMWKKIDGHFYSCLMMKEARSSGQKYFMIDFDTKDEVYKKHFEHELRDLTEIILIQETRNGYHYKVKPFNRELLPGKDYYEIKIDANFFVEYVGD